MRISDWSSDVFSSDLCRASPQRSFCGRSEGRSLRPIHIRPHTMSLYSWLSIGPDDLLWTGIGMTKRKHQLLTESERDQILAIQIGRASGRERVCQYV